MSQEEFKFYMDQQIQEIKKYQAKKSRESNDIDTNECVFEWIKNHAKTFRQNWIK